MYDSKLVQMDSESSRIEDVWQQVKPLSTDEKAELVKRLLGKESGLVLVSTSTHLVDYIIAQMSLLSSEGLGYVQSAIAARIACEGSRSKR